MELMMRLNTQFRKNEITFFIQGWEFSGMLPPISFGLFFLKLV